MGNCCGKKLVEQDSGTEILLHGNLKFHIKEARDLPDTDNTFFNISRGDLTDPYLEVEISNTDLLKTDFKHNDLNPKWDEKFNIPVCHSADVLMFKVKDREHIGSQTVGTFTIDISEVVKGELIKGPNDGWFDVIVGKDGETQGSVLLELQYFPVGEYAGKVLNDAYFESKSGNRVTLYQDAMTPQLPVFDTIVNPDGSPYKPTNCWRDLFHAINNAQKIVYITGWSVYTSIGLLRGEEAAENDDSNIGELLKKKAEQGVTVLVMVWNEASNDGGIMDGLLGTHDEDTTKYFKDTRVICANVQRAKESWLGLGSTFVATCYTHHQKTIIVDAAKPDGSEDRRLVAFLGGLDITDGRYDTPEFPLFKSIHNVHVGDFYSKCIPDVTCEVGPREPWHDIHSKLEGPVVMDVCRNFIDRWSKQAADYEGYLLDMSEGFDLEYVVPIEEGEGGPWEVQILRSITSDSAMFDDARKGVLHRKYGRLVDNSIMKSYVNLIRNASNYIYIENQYFMGSAFSWFKDRSAMTNHIIPKEISQKIVSKINAGEKFKVYVTIPMYPEGDPHSMPSQEILYWQKNTIESMFKAVAKGIEQAGIDAHPQDYLNFYCLGKREGPEDIPDDFVTPSDPDSFLGKTIKNIRHPIYVHSKLMIVDDDYVIVGSANINQRSLGGERDTEICMGAFQPDHMVEKSGDSAHGGIHTFRTALWAAHLGGGDPVYNNPASDECLAKIKQVSSDFWQLYTAEEPTHSDVHLLPYPLTVAETGDISPLEAPYNCFPDTKAKVVGSKSSILPAKLTT